MYSLEINFLKDRQIHHNKPSQQAGFKFPTGDMTPVYLGLGLGICFPALVGGGWLFLQAKNGELEQNISQLEQQNKQLDTQVGNVKKIEEETNSIKTETQSLITVFDQIRPWSAILQDLRDRIPRTVQIQTLKQIAPTPPAPGKPATRTAGGIELTGLARSFNDVNDFLLTLQQSPFLKSSESKIVSATLVDAPLPPNGGRLNNGVVIKPPQVVNYTIQLGLTDVPATELIRELEQKGTVGLVTRLRSIQPTGVIKK